MSYRDPTKDELKDPLWNRIWQEIKSWDINVPAEYGGYCGATGNHVCAIFDAVRDPHPPSAERPNLGELREQLARVLMDHCTSHPELGAEWIPTPDTMADAILPIIEQRERESRLDEHCRICPNCACCNSCRAACPRHIELKSQPKEGGK